MRKFALILAMVGLAILLALLLASPKKIESTSLDGLRNGELVSIEGIVDEVRETRAGSILNIKEIRIFCECKNIHAGEKVSVEGVVEDFDNNLQIKALILDIIP